MAGSGNAGGRSRAGAGPGARNPLLTDAELKVLAAIEDLIEELGHAPTYAELLKRIKWRSKGSLHQYMERLRGHGVIAGSGRGLRVIR
jgi:SOS-response transcriptional repressor LexA